MNLKEENTILTEGIKPLRSLKHSPINAYFSKNSSDFVVREVPLYEFSANGEHLIIHIAKKDLSTREALRILSEHSGIKLKDFGYAGLKDKQGQTFQYISLPKKFASSLENFSHEKLKIVASFIHNNKLKIGHLKGNSFFIRLKKVSKLEALKLENAFKTLCEQGYPNYFGYQRFGKFKDNFKQGFELLQGAKKLKNPKMHKFLLSAFQSELFNRYLSKRVELSHFAKDFSPQELANIYKIEPILAKSLKAQKPFFKLLENEVLGHYPYGKCFLCEDLASEIARFEAKDIAPLGLLLGAKAYESKEGFAKSLENEIFAPFEALAKNMQGSRRFLWSFIEQGKCTYDEEKAHFTLEFFLQKGSYATIILHELLGQDEAF